MIFLLCKLISSNYLLHILILLLLEDFFFYFSHRLLHFDFLYKYVHKQHHEFYNTISIACLYAHPIEFILGNLMPHFIPMFVLGSSTHIITLTSWTFLNLMETHETHSGYQFPVSLFTLFPFSSKLKR